VGYVQVINVLLVLSLSILVKHTHKAKFTVKVDRMISLTSQSFTLNWSIEIQFHLSFSASGIHASCIDVTRQLEDLELIIYFCGKG